MKTCRICGIEKEDSFFYVGYLICKSCSAERYKSQRYKYQKEYRQSEKYKESIKKYRQSKKGREASKKYRQSEKLMEYQKEYQKEYRQSEKCKDSKKKYRQSEKGRETVLYENTKYNLKKQIGETPPPELVEVKVLINKTKQLCKTLKS